MKVWFGDGEGNTISIGNGEIYDIVVHYMKTSTPMRMEVESIHYEKTDPRLTVRLIPIPQHDSDCVLSGEVVDYPITIEDGVSFT